MAPGLPMPTVAQSSLPGPHTIPRNRLPAPTTPPRPPSGPAGRRAHGEERTAGASRCTARVASVASPIICRSALAIEAHRGVASLANTDRYGLRDAPCAALRWLRAAYDI